MRLVFMAVLAVLSLSSSAYAEGVSVSALMHPFTTDGCSSWPDGWPGNETQWRHCCVLHDVRYWMGGTRVERKAADHELGRCIGASDNSQLTKIMGELMAKGVRVGGEPGLPFTWRWGYGWKVDRGYAPLSDDEKRLVNQFLPQHPLAVQVTNPGILVTIPAQTEDRCEDLVRSEFAKAEGVEPLHVEKYARLKNVYEVTSVLCTGSMFIQADTTSCSRTENTPIVLHPLGVSGICYMPRLK
jgi:hypothetical protein